MPHVLNGVSTGALIAVRDDIPAALAVASLISAQAVELNIGYTGRLRDAVRHLSMNPGCLNAFAYVSAHGPEFHRSDEPAVDMALLKRLPARVQTIVLHADSLGEDLDSLRAMGSRIAIENMDTRKAFGTTTEDLCAVFAELPEAGFVLDIAHAHAHDSSGSLTDELAGTFADRLRHLHCSVIDPITGEHLSPTAADVEWLTRDLARVPSVPRIWEEIPTFAA